MRKQMEITISVSKKGRAVVILNGKFNIEHVQIFEEKMSQLFSAKAKLIVIDLKKVRLIDSSGIGSLIKTLNTAKNSESELILINITEEIANIFSISYLDKFFTIKTDKELMRLYPDLNL
ncbi:MAG: hypothetical protein CVV44_13520 [Spirochaetae bacterium HGW-Spirochaetae-1]|nr:MAG: hypothetical protein CVV44_13520 [Spirochaetae bacterium HGW-Spirochaetae-1]